MPELPDVETFKQYLDHTALHHTIDKVSVEAPEMLGELSTRAFQRRLTGHTLERSRRHGKYLFAGLEDGDWLVFHFGMTGALKYLEGEEQAPRYTRILLSFKDGSRLAYVNTRKLGKVVMTDDVDEFLHQHDLGPDALQLDLEQFRSQARAHRGSVKTWLMNQEILAGIGNIYSDEILFQAHLHPEHKVESLSDQEIKTLYRKMHEVLDKTIAVHADPSAMPRRYLIPHRKKGEHCPVCKTPITQFKISGRSGYYCPQCQPS